MGQENETGNDQSDDNDMGLHYLDDKKSKDVSLNLYDVKYRCL